MHSEQEYAVYPLSLYDLMSKESGITMGWLVEGLLDLERTNGALTRLVAKWPMLGGRLELDSRSRLQIRAPLGSFPVGYAPFILTSRTSGVPITDFIELPLPVVSNVLPAFLFTDESAPKGPNAWITEDIPLMYWHLTFFTKGEHQYTCLGFTFSHGVFDGMGVAAVIHGMEAETLQKPWPVPLPLHVGHNNNHLEGFLERTKRNMREKHKTLASDYTGTSVYGLWLMITFLLWHLWQEKWHGVQSRLIRIPSKVYEKLVEDARKSLAEEGITGIRVSTGEVLAAWLSKVIYSGEENVHNLINLTNMASLRTFANGTLNQYAHNCFIPMSYPLFSVKQLQTTPIHILAYELGKARSKLLIGHGLYVYNQIEECAKPRKGLFKPVQIIVPFNSAADESLTMTNVSIGRVVDINWRGLGGGRTICRYKSVFTDSPFIMSNLLTIAGRLDDGSTIVDVVLNRRRLKLLEDDLHKLVARTSV